MIVVAVVAALAAACSNSLAAYLQQGANKRLSSEGSVPPSKVPALVREPRWLAGQVFDVSAFLLQAVALAFGTLVFVEPLLVLSLPISVGLRAWSARQRPTRVGVVGSLLCLVALSVFIGVGRPTPGNASLTGGEAVALGAAAGALLLAGLGCAAATRGNNRAVAFAGAASTAYGVTAGLTKVVTGQLQHGGVLQPLQSWELYAAIVAGLLGVFLTQNALKPGSLAAPVAVITLGDPLVAIAIGLLWLGESVNAASWAVGLEVLALSVMAVGVAVLAHQSESASAPTGESRAGSGGGEAQADLSRR